MALKRFLTTFIGAAIVAGTLSGCEGGFDPGAMLGAESRDLDAEVEAEGKPVKKKPRKKAAPPPDAAVAEGVATPKPGPSTKPRAFLYRNVAFDKVRTRAMRQVYEGQTKKALTTFQSAERLRPSDPAVKMWMAAIRESAKKPRSGDPAAIDDFKAAAQQLRAPGATVGAPAANGAGQSVGQAPSLPRPAMPQPAATPFEVDPRSVF
jgi:hypothetical protein